MATLTQITETIRAGLGDGPGLDRTLKLDLGPDGVIHVDGALVTNEDGPADCTLVLRLDDLVALARGRLDPAMAMMRGRLKVRGDMSVAMRLPGLLAKARPAGGWD